MEPEKDRSRVSYSLPSVSVVIPTFGRPKFLARAIESVRNQTNLPMEVLVIDDNGLSTPAQIDTEVMISEMSVKPLSVRYIANERNSGAGYARNVGVAQAEGEFIAFLDDDDEWLPGFLAKGVASLEVDSADVAYCDCLIVDDRKPTIRKPEINRKYRGDVWKELLAGWCPSSTSLFILRKSALGDGMIFDSSLGTSVEDYDCWLRLARHCQFAFHDEPSVIRHHHSAGQATSDAAARRIAIRKLERKWSLRLTEVEAILFQHALRNLCKQTHRTGFQHSIRHREPKNALLSAVNFLTTGKFSLRDFYVLARSLL